ncbi:hypothetical protein FQA39_LY00659 [Lamprigera yunnana]|nr:hypothetical protein FQA39_LY00659 [Lamprigera yunnana]
MTENQIKTERKSVIKLDTVERLMHIPAVEYGWNYAGQMYGNIKQSNNFIHWTCSQAEVSIYAAVNKVMPAITLFHGPISTIDKVFYHGLERVEQKVPVINLPPEQIYSNTKKFVTDIINHNLIADVISKAQIVKSLALESKYTGFAAETVEGALKVADKYVDFYLPPDSNETIEEPNQVVPNDGTITERAINTIHHVDKFSRKLQRRLTKRTLAEAKVLKEHTFEAIHALVHVIKLVTTDPKTALHKGQELWTALSKNEPENQAAPQNLEEVLILLTRESARRIVHFVNFSSVMVKQLPDQMQGLALKCISLIQDFVKNGHLENVNHTILESAGNHFSKMTMLLHQLKFYTTALLEQVVKSIEHEYEGKQLLVTEKSYNDNLCSSENNSNSKLNGIENSN